MSEKILIVDDSIESLSLFEKLLTRALPGLVVSFATSGKAALEAVAAGTFDLILLDAMMPEMTGFEVCRTLKSDPVTRTIPLLMISGIMVSSEHRLSGMQCGAEGYVCKPFEPEELVAQVRILLRMKQYEDQLRLQEVRLERELAERTKSLRASEEQFRMLFDNSPDAIFVEDLNGLVLNVNPAACRLHGMTRDALVGSSVFDLVPATLRDQVSREFPRWYTGGRVAHESMSRGKDGQSIPVEICANPINYRGQAALLFHVRDISERKRSEEQLRRTANLESVGLLAGGLAHDFNNLLAGVLGNISYARLENPSRETLMQVLEEAERAALRAKSLTQQLLTFAKGGKPVRKASSVPELLEENVRFVLAGSKSAYRLHVQPGLWNAYMDDGQISQVVENIVINADQAMPRGGTITIAVENLAGVPDTGESGRPLKPGRYVRITICDQGVGMSPDVMARIFEPYFTTKSAGSGLGLAVAYSIMTQHEGTITVQSNPGQGATFTMYLPATDEAPSSRPVNQSEPLHRGAGRILVMDDEPFLRTLLSRMLDALGYKAVCLANGEAALAAYREAQASGNCFDAVILDLTIPGGMGGEETLQALRKLDPKVRAIVSSGYALEPVFSSYLEHGFLGGIAKPYDMRMLSDVLTHVLGEKKRD